LQLKNGAGLLVTVTLDDLDLRVRLQKGDELEEDVSCDSAYMLEAMRRVGTSMREVFHWVPEDKPVYLFMDNAGGHGVH